MQGKKMTLYLFLDTGTVTEICYVFTKPLSLVFLGTHRIYFSQPHA